MPTAEANTSRLGYIEESSVIVRKAFLIYNPASGQKRDRRTEHVSGAAEVLRAHGVEVETCPTTDAGSATRQTQQAIVRGFDTVIACGGDGTVNEVLNGLMLVGPGADVSLGVIPLGSGNLLATDLLLSKNTEIAARALLAYRPRDLHPGLISYQTGAGPQKRWFIVAAGVGADAQVMYRTAATGAKDRYGIYAYFMEMARMAWRRHFPMFELEWRTEDGGTRTEKVALVMALRSGKFPGILRRVHLDSALVRNKYRLMLFKTDRVLRFLNFFLSVVSGRNWSVPDVELAVTSWFRCTPLSAETSTAIHTEADGELLGRLPVEVGIDERTFRLLMP